VGHKIGKSPNSEKDADPTEKYGGADETRTRDLLRDRQHQKYYLAGPSSFVLRHVVRFRPVFGS
jgi:hypothetical protein